MDLQEISLQLQAGKAKIVKKLVQEAIDAGIPAQTILEEGLLSGMNVIGVKFKNNEVFVPEVLVAARAMNQGAALLKPLLMEDGAKAMGISLSQQQLDAIVEAMAKAFSRLTRATSSKGAAWGSMGSSISAT